MKSTAVFAMVALITVAAVSHGCATGGRAGSATPVDGGEAYDARSDVGAETGNLVGDGVAPTPACAAAQNSHNSVGCEYFTYFPDAYEDTGQFDCFAAFVANVSSTPVKITVDLGGMPLDNNANFIRQPMGTGPATSYAPLANSTLPAGQVAILFLADADAGVANAVHCPAGVKPAYTFSDSQASGISAHGSGIVPAFHISTDGPVVAYDIFPYGGGDSALTAATLLLPTSVWGTNYVAVDATMGTASFAPWIAIVAQADSTHVTIRPTAYIAPGPGVAGAVQNVPTTYVLQRGQVLQLEEAAGPELTGSPIQADRPVGVFGGITCMDLPADSYACDTAHQQLAPVSALGHEYVYARYRDRFAETPESAPVRFVGAVDGTTLAYDPSPPPGAPATLSTGQIADFTTTSPFTVKSQDDMHPFFVAAYMTGCGVYGTASDCRGDPEFVNVVPPQQYMGKYDFFTDPTYPETELVIVRQKNKNGGFDDVTLDCLAAPVSGWQQVGTAGGYQYARVDLVTGNFNPVGNCNSGRHEMQSDTPFGLTVWGWGSAATGDCQPPPGGTGFCSQAVSYAYPAGMEVAPIAPVVVPAQ